MAYTRTLYYLISPRCPCYCGGEGLLQLLTCPGCRTIVGCCDEVGELIQDVRTPRFLPNESVNGPGQLCPFCRAVDFGEFRPATLAEIRVLGIEDEQLRTR